MTNFDPNLRKAAVLLRSLDADTAAVMLGQLSAEEAATIRAAMRAVGQVEPNEQADVVAAFRDSRPTKQHATGAGDVELALSRSFTSETYSERDARPNLAAATVASAKRFEFLENAPIHALAPQLAREHAQTIAVVLSHLAPERAAAVLAALPQKVQAEAIERLSSLGETDEECVSVLERELEAWAAKRDGLRAEGGRRRDTMAAILAAADPKSRGQILSNMKDHKVAVSNQFAAHKSERVRPKTPKSNQAPRKARGTDIPVCHSLEVNAFQRQTRMSAPQAKAPLPQVAFDDLIYLDSRALSAVLRQVDANLLALALAGSRDELVDRICEQMPKRTGREFRRQLRRLGPTRLSDVEGAQRAVAQVAAQQLSEPQPSLAMSHA